MITILEIKITNNLKKLNFSCKYRLNKYWKKKQFQQCLTPQRAAQVKHLEII